MTAIYLGVLTSMGIAPARGLKDSSKFDQIMSKAGMGSRTPQWARDNAKILNPLFGALGASIALFSIYQMGRAGLELYRGDLVSASAPFGTIAIHSATTLPLGLWIVDHRPQVVVEKEPEPEQKERKISPFTKRVFKVLGNDLKSITGCSTLQDLNRWLFENGIEGKDQWEERFEKIRFRRGKMLASSVNKLKINLAKLDRFLWQEGITAESNMAIAVCNLIGANDDIRRATGQRFPISGGTVALQLNNLLVEKKLETVGAWEERFGPLQKPGESRSLAIERLKANLKFPEMPKPQIQVPTVSTVRTLAVDLLVIGALVLDVARFGKNHRYIAIGLGILTVPVIGGAWAVSDYRIQGSKADHLATAVALWIGCRAMPWVDRIPYFGTGSRFLIGALSIPMLTHTLAQIGARKIKSRR